MRSNTKIASIFIGSFMTLSEPTDQGVVRQWDQMVGTVARIILRRFPLLQCFVWGGDAVRCEVRLFIFYSHTLLSVPWTLANCYREANGSTLRHCYRNECNRSYEIRSNPVLSR